MECGASPGGRSKTGRQAAGAQRPTPCEAAGRATKIKILVGISIFVEASKLLLPTLGRSANLSEPWAPRKDTSRSFAHFYINMFKYSAISNFYHLYFMRFLIKPFRVRVVSLRVRSNPRRPQQNRKESGGRAAPDALRGRRPSKCRYGHFKASRFHWC